MGGTALALALVLAPALPDGSASLADYGWGAVSGVGTGVGVAWVGMAAVLPALWLVSQDTPGAVGRGKELMPEGVPSALVASVGIGLQFLAMAQVDGDSGLWPVVLSRVVSVVVIVVVLASYGSRWTVPLRAWAVAVVAGMVGTAAIVLYLEATTRQLMAVATVLSSLYPAVPVVLALLFLGERLNRRQGFGLLCAALAIGLIALR
ncbi:Uncharacterized membrane protein [Streptomyces sp. 3213]|uniref:DMT family transporter n=1 Tax=Streptomyces sp. 3213.3 TaxID=1855348 RepID=UPI0008954BA3|nr:DMT family transporter [Streptomyces sp. 3213.3]SEE52350.1 Uncharacterized membrane protein [Streptomyces sp. 3213] [Streptomyces sp. 3213.3]